MNCTENFMLFSKQTIDLLDNKQLSFNNWMKILFYMQYMCGFHTRGLYSFSRQPSPRSKYLPSPPMTLTTSQSLPPSSASSVIIMSGSIDLAGLAHRKNSLTLHCFLTWNSNQSDKTLPSLPPSFDTKQVSHPPTVTSRPVLSADTWQDSKPPVFFPATLAWTMSVFKRKLSLSPFSKITQI